jgi:MFS family permease
MAWRRTNSRTSLFMSSSGSLGAEAGKALDYNTNYNKNNSSSSLSASGSAPSSLQSLPETKMHAREPTLDQHDEERDNGNSSYDYDDEYDHDNTHTSDNGAHHHHQQQPQERPSLFVIKVTAIASLGGVLFGYDLGVISAALPQLTDYFDLNSKQQELVVAILYVGGGLGAAVGGSLCDAAGRKRAILWTDGLFLLGALVLMTAPSLHFILAGRVIVGFAIAVSGIADVSYLHEIAPIQWRGAIVSVNEASISLGFLLAFAVGNALSGDDEGNSDNGWRTMFGVSGLVALVQMIGMRNMPESPIWLEQQGRHEESEAAFRKIRSSDSSVFAETDSGNNNMSSPPRSGNVSTSYEAVSSPDTSFEDILATITPTTGPYSTGILGRCSFCFSRLVYLLQQFRLFVVTTMQSYRRQAYIAIFLSVTQQFCGQTNVLSYAPVIFASVAGGDNASSLSAVGGNAILSIGLVKFAVTVLVIWKIETLGRRFLLLAGMATIAAGLLLLIIAFGGTRVETQQNGEAAVDDEGAGFYFALPGVLLVVSGYSMSFGPLTWLLTSELFPAEIRGRALGANTIVTYVCAAIVTYTFLTSQELFGSTFVFGFYLIVTCLGFLFAYTAIPDTGGKTVEEIENDLKGMLWWKAGRVHISDSGADGEVIPLAAFQSGESNRTDGRPTAILETELT